MHDVTNARLEHRSQVINEAFRFVPATRSRAGNLLARLTGVVQTGPYAQAIEEIGIRAFALLPTVGSEDEQPHLGCVWMKDFLCQ